MTDSAAVTCGVEPGERGVVGVTARQSAMLAAVFRRLHPLLLGTALTAAACAATPHPAPTEAARDFDPAEIRAAEARVIAALESTEPTAWVYLYTEDAVLLESTEFVEGRPALLAMARAMKPLSHVAITPDHTEGHGSLAFVSCSGSWSSGGKPTKVRALMIWRKEADGMWRIAREVLTPIAPPS